ncbi:MAG: pseudaminic acid synthase [Planctomycetes bacterium]|nr:pseudaminic acid synthase [Planctomycetota bacterium]
MKKTIQLDEKQAGEGHPCYIIAEIGSNHNRDIDTAKKLIEVAKESGCDAAKFQSYTADELYSIYTPRISEMDGRSEPSETLYELIKRIQMPIEWHQELKDYCDKVGITFCSTPFDESMVDVLESVNAPFYKVASFEITHYPLLEKIAKTGKPVILSTGNSDLGDVERAITCLEENACSTYALLHCISQYPAELADINLRCIDTLRIAFDCVVGFSDHTTDSLSSSMAVALGASIIEKHITLDKRYFGPDHPFALEPDELKQFVQAIRNSEAILGTSVKRMRRNEEENHRIGRRSLVASMDIREGETITADKLLVKRPGLGLSPQYFNLVIGKEARTDIPKDKWITWDCLI